ncbi:MAG TPA: helix-hairpin-helix domain-containing protein [Rhodanobacteraceae bacterium]
MIRKLAALALLLAVCLPAWASSPVNINTANAATIAAALDGVGMAKAKAIVSYRKAHGPFKSIDDLAKVKGIGPAIVKRNHGSIHLSGTYAPPRTSQHHRHTHKKVRKTGNRPSKSHKPKHRKH